MSATNARINFGELLRQVAQEGQRIIIERSGRPQAVILPLADYEQLKASQEPAAWKVLLEQARQRVRDELGERELPDPAEIIQQMRGERDEQFTNLR